MNFSRKLILVAGAALLAACGDKVTVAAPVTPTPPVTKINSVDVAPSSATITVGDIIQFSAGVNADAGVTPTTAWTVSSSTGISVTDGNSGGKVTTTAAAVPGSYAVCAEASAGTQKVKNCATLIIQKKSDAIPATVSIASITEGNFNTPVDPNNVKGQFDVRLNFNPGNQVVDSVQLFVNDVLAGSQSFSSAQSAALRFAAEAAIAAQATLPMVTFSVHSEAYKGQFTPALPFPKFAAGDVAGTPAWYNGSNAVKAKLYTGGATTAVTATVAQILNFTNLNGFHGTMTVTGGFAAANDIGGYTWRRGVVNVSAVPVIYQKDLTLRSAFVTLGGTGCDVGGPDSSTVAVAAGSPIPNPSVHVLTSESAYEFRRQGGGMDGIRAAGVLDMSCDARYRRGGEIPTITGITNEQSGSLGGSQNNNLLTVDGGFLNSLALSAQPDQNLIVRLDNLAPSGGSIKIVKDSTTLNETNWVNAVYHFEAGYSQAADFGVSYLAPLLDYQLLAGYKTSPITYKPASTKPIMTSAAYSTTATLQPGACPGNGCPLPDSISNVTYNIAAKTRDALGNELYMPQSAGTGTHHLRTFGIDRHAPVIATTGDLGDPLFKSQFRDTVTIDVPAGQWFGFTGVDSLSGFVGYSNAITRAAMDAEMVRLRPNSTGHDSRWLMTSLNFDPTLLRTTVGTPISTPFTQADAGWVLPTSTTPTTPAYSLFNGPPIAISMNATMTFAADATPAGYYIAQARVRDQAGNVSTQLTRKVYVNNGSIPLITGLNSVTGPYTGGATVQFPTSAQDSVLIVDGRLGLVYPVLGYEPAAAVPNPVGYQVYVPNNRPNPAVWEKFKDHGGNPTTVPFTETPFIRNMQGFTAGATLPTQLYSSGTLTASGVAMGCVTLTGAANLKPTLVAARVYNGWPLGNFNAPPTFDGTKTGVSDIGVGGSGFSAEFGAPILSTQVQAGSCYTQPGNFDSVTVSISTPPTATFDTRIVTFVAWGAGGDQAQNCVGAAACGGVGGRTPFPAPFDRDSQLRLLFNSGAATDREWVRQTAIAPTFITNIGWPFPTLDNGKYRNYQWQFTVTRVPGTPTRLSVLGVNSLFDGLVTLPTMTLAW